MTRFLTAAFLLFPTLASAGSFTVNSAETSVGFEVIHWRLSTVAGSFSDVTGEIDWDASNPTATRAVISVPIMSVDTANGQRDAHLRRADIFDAAQWPVATFTSTQVSNIKGDDFDLIGTLSMKGVEHPITLHVKDMNDGGATATATMDRFLWNVVYGNSLAETGSIAISQQVELKINLAMTAADDRS